MNKICIRLPDGNIHVIETQKTSLRNCFLSFGHHLPPYEVSLLLNENTNTLVGKNEELKADVPYKIIDGRELIKCYNTLKDRNTKNDKLILEFQQQLEVLQQKLNDQQLAISKEEKQKFEDFQNKYLQLEFQFNNQIEKNQKLQQEYDYTKQQQQVQKQELEKLQNQFENDKKQIEKVKKKYQQYKVQMKETMEEKSKYESKITALEKDVQYISLKITERESQIKKLEDELTKEKEENKTLVQQLLNKEAERLKEAEARHQLYVQQNQAQFMRSTGSLVAMQQIQDNLNQDIQIQQDLLNSDQRIKSYEDQVEQLRKQISNQDDTIQKANQDSKKLKQQKEELELKILQMEKEISEQEIRLKNLNKLIDAEDSEFIKMQGKVEQVEADLYNNYKYRLMRIVELIPRTYRDQVEFAVEELFDKKLYLNKGQVTNQTYKFYLLDYAKVKDIIFKENNLDIKQSIITSYKFNIHGQLTSKKIVADQQIQDKSELVDSLQLYYATSIDHLSGELTKIKSEKSDKIYIIKETYITQSKENLGSYEYALDQLSRSIAAQIILNQFVEDLKQKNINVPFQFSFAQPALFSNSTHFKQYFIELTKKQPQEQQPKAFSLIKQFLEQLTDDNSNEFYSSLREYQLQKKTVQGQGTQQASELDMQDQIDFLQNFNNILPNQNCEDIIKKYKQFSNEEKVKAFKYLLELLSDTCDDFPLEKYFYGYELKLSDLQDANVFRKYNGGNMNFEASEEGKFLSALSYYSIKKTHSQFCVSHIQGIGNQLYDPMISSYDGFLNCLDQGINEIRRIESSFESCDPQNIGYKYIKALDITMQ
ncbi:unnamed protein product [Paramecium octaurelia]|uniref:Alpha-type protein kinase domain-containing protein n=1 Tax=Paramecium octaurelia TaxID=43137 RepID=A0A8S1V728_PAROT|nr:unnamed protein product [Paramecium octaurelia]